MKKTIIWMILKKICQLENKTMSHRYPDERKSPRVHSYRLGNKVYPRGGTEQEKEAFILDNKSLFEL